MFIKKYESSFALVVVYVDDMNLICTLDNLAQTAEYLKREFDVKDRKDKIMSWT